jgi:hypothetical protein
VDPDHRLGFYRWSRFGRYGSGLAAVFRQRLAGQGKRHRRVRRLCMLDRRCGGGRNGVDLSAAAGRTFLRGLLAGTLITRRSTNAAATATAATPPPRPVLKLAFRFFGFRRGGAGCANRRARSTMTLRSRCLGYTRGPGLAVLSTVLPARIVAALVAAILVPALFAVRFPGSAGFLGALFRACACRDALKIGRVFLLFHKIGDV